MVSLIVTLAHTSMYCSSSFFLIWYAIPNKCNYLKAYWITRHFEREGEKRAVKWTGPFWWLHASQLCLCVYVQQQSSTHANCLNDIQKHMHVHNRTQKALEQGAQNSAPQRTKHQTSSYRESLYRSCKWESCIFHTHTHTHTYTHKISVLAVLDITLFGIYYEF